MPRVFGEVRFEGRAVGDVDPMEAEVWAALEAGEPPLFQPRIVGVVEIVDPRDLMPRVEEHFSHFRRDETGATGYEVAFHLIASHAPPVLADKQGDRSDKWPEGR